MDNGLERHDDNAISARSTGSAFQASMLRRTPYLLIVIRFLLGPLLYWDASDGVTGNMFLVGLGVALLTDFFDGVLARRLGVVTAHLRETDGRVDMWFYAWIALSAWSTRADVVASFVWPIIFVISCQLLAWIVDFIKYQRFSNYHAYSAKAWGVTLFALTIAWFSYADVTFWLWLAVFFGVLCTVEEIAITLTLPEWTYDVPSIVHAVRMKRASIDRP